MEKAATGLAWTLKVQVEAFQEDGDWVAICPALDVASQGETREHAFKMLEEALIGYFECLSELGTLWEVLDEKRLTPAVAAVLRTPTADRRAHWLDIPIWLLPGGEVPQASTFSTKAVIRNHRAALSRPRPSADRGAGGGCCDRHG